MLNIEIFNLIIKQFGPQSEDGIYKNIGIYEFINIDAERISYDKNAEVGCQESVCICIMNSNSEHPLNKKLYMAISYLDDEQVIDSENDLPPQIIRQELLNLYNTLLTTTTNE